MVRIKSRIFDNRMDNLEEIPKTVMKESLPKLKKETPIASGNARRRTSKQRLKIKSDYAYAGRLDDGWSKQSPKGFTDPTIDFIERRIEQLTKRI